MRRESEAVFQPGQLSATVPWPEPWTAEDVIDVLGPMVLEARRARLDQVLAQRLGSVTVLLDSPHDPHNGAAILRSCDAFGVQELHVIPKRESFLASNVVAKGAERWVDVIEHPGAAEAGEHLSARGYALVATHPKGSLVPEDLAGLERVCLVLGNERDGISPELAARATESVCIPMVGFVESLNVSVSTAILLRAATRGRPGDLDHAARQRLLARGLYHSVPRAREILATIGSRKPGAASDR